MTQILIRADASLSIGSGHVMRCRTLARELQRRGAEICFLCRRQQGDLITLLEQDFHVWALPELPLLPYEGLQERNLYGAWLGCSQDRDAADCLQVLEQAGIRAAEWLVVDHYGLDAQWQAQLLDGLGQPKLLVIDDLADRAHLANLLLDQNFFGEATEGRYQSLVPNECLQLLGPHYALLASEYAQLHPLVPPRTELRRVMVFFGGVDPDNLTGRTLEALSRSELADLAVDVVLGLQSPHRQAVAELVARRPNTTLHWPLPSLAGLIARSDLAIGAGGATTWERACLGLPSMVVTIADNQLPFAQALDQAGKVQLLGQAATVSTDQIRVAVIAAKQQYRPCASCHDLTDGWGAGRVATALMGLQGPLTLRPVDATDEFLLLRWAKDPGVGVNSFSPGPIASCDHNRWFQAGLTDANRLHLIASDSFGCPLGEIRFDRCPPGPTIQTREALINLSLDTCARGLGLTTDLVQMGMREMEKRWGLATEAITEGHAGNAASQATFAKAGYRLDDISDAPPLGSTCDTAALEPSSITLLSDAGTWLNQYLPQLIEALWHRGHAVRWIHQPCQLAPGHVCLLLSCGRLLNSDQLHLHCHNLVVHESALPKGQGWSPMTWQILEGARHIPVTLFEATAALDAGPIYLQETIELQGSELVEEWRALQAGATIGLCLEWFDQHYKVIAQAAPQQGPGSYYRRRRQSDSQLDLAQPLSDQFNLLRVVDNDSYPAFIECQERRYILQIQPAPKT
jgi:UDP-2,4-diacetamido-2,4,6-trideoxy-beta-L-altropyranose hydrolase